MRAAPSALTALIATIAFASSASVVSAGEAWDAIRASIFADKTIHDGHGVVTFDAPARPEDMRVVPVSAKAAFTDGRTIKTVTFLIDENPTPVVAEFKMGPGRDAATLLVNFRVDRQSDARVVVEASDGQLYMVSRLIKYAGGQSSCSAPPTGDPAEIAANMGKMSLSPAKGAAGQSASPARPTAELVLRHPNHTGMVMDQITLLYTPLRMVSDITVEQAGELVFSATGSIALSQDPRIVFDYARTSANEMSVTFKDTDGGAWTRTFPIPAS